MAPYGQGGAEAAGALIIGLLLLAFGVLVAFAAAGAWRLCSGGSGQPAPSPCRWCLSRSPPAAAVVAATPVPAAGPRLALVVDDWGYQARPIEELPKMGFPLTTAVLPNLPYSSKAAERRPMAWATRSSCTAPCRPRATSKVKWAP